MNKFCDVVMLPFIH